MLLHAEERCGDCKIEAHNSSMISSVLMSWETPVTCLVTLAVCLNIVILVIFDLQTSTRPPCYNEVILGDAQGCNGTSIHKISHDSIHMMLLTVPTLWLTRKGTTLRITFYAFQKIKFFAIPCMKTETTLTVFRMA